MGLFKIHIEKYSHISKGPMSWPMGLFLKHIEIYSHISQGPTS